MKTMFKLINVYYETKRKLQVNHFRSWAAAGKERKEY